MKTIIAGSRDITELSVIMDAINMSGIISDISEIVSGGCRGVDHLGELWAISNNVPVKQFPADWDTHGRAAGPIRNRSMAKYADSLIAIWDGKSKGTKNMIDEARDNGLWVYVHRV